MSGDDWGKVAALALLVVGGIIALLMAKKRLRKVRIVREKEEKRQATMRSLAELWEELRNQEWNVVCPICKAAPGRSCQFKVVAGTGASHLMRQNAQIKLDMEARAEWLRHNFTVQKEDWAKLGRNQRLIWAAVFIKKRQDDTFDATGLWEADRPGVVSVHEEELEHVL
jgi:hypothetical protein